MEEQLINACLQAEKLYESEQNSSSGYTVEEWNLSEIRWQNVQYLPSSEDSDIEEFSPLSPSVYSPVVPQVMSEQSSFNGYTVEDWNLTETKWQGFHHHPPSEESDIEELSPLSPSVYSPVTSQVTSDRLSSNGYTVEDWNLPDTSWQGLQHHPSSEESDIEEL